MRKCFHLLMINLNSFLPLSNARLWVEDDTKYFTQNDVIHDIFIPCNLGRHKFSLTVDIILGVLEELLVAS